MHEYHSSVQQVMEFQLSYFKSEKDDDVKVLHSICQQIWKTQQRPQDWKRSVFISIPKKGNAKECSNYRSIALISHASKVRLRILQVRVQQYMNREFQIFKLDLEKQKNQRSYYQHPLDHGESKIIPETQLLLLLITPKPLTVWITTNCGKFFKRWEYQTTWSAS